MKSTYFAFSLIVLVFSKSLSQDLLGTRTGNYSGVSGIALNPSSMVDSKLRFDVNISTFAFSVDNNYIFIPKKDLKFLGFKNLINKASNNGFTDDYKYGSGDKKGYFGFFIQGPSAMMNVGRHAFSIFYNARLEFNIDKVHFAAAKLALEDMRFDPLENDFNGTNPANIFNAKNFSVNSLAWAEWGGSYGTSILLKKRHHIKGAITLKYLQGMGGGYIENPDLKFYMHGGLDDTTWNIDAQNFEYGRVDYWSYGNLKKYKDLIHGKGFGFDLGFTYEHYKKDADSYKYQMDGQMLTDPVVTKYDYRIGLSLLDFGSVSYKDEFSGTFRIDGNNPLYDQKKYGATNNDWFHEKIESQMDFDTTYSKLFYGTPYDTKISDQFNMNLPTALSLQADVNVWKKLFVNATIIKSV
jgi:hypothetical protein